MMVLVCQPILPAVAWDMTDDVKTGSNLSDLLTASRISAICKLIKISLIVAHSELARVGPKQKRAEGKLAFGFLRDATEKGCIKFKGYQHDSTGARRSP